MESDIIMYSKSEQKFITYHQNIVKAEKKKVYDQKREMANKCHDRFIKKFGDELIQVGFSPDQVSSKIHAFESSIVVIGDVFIMAHSNGNVGRDIKFYIMKKCRKCMKKYEQYKDKEEINRIDDIGRLLLNDSDDRLCWDCHKEEERGEIE